MSADRTRAQQRARLDALDVPDCHCQVYQRCPECGAPAGADCVRACCFCAAEWPRGLPCCPGCGAAVAPCNPVPCPLTHRPRPWRPPCPHVLAADHGTPFEDWLDDLHFYDDAGDYADRPSARLPTAVPPGPAKVAALANRAADGTRFWHPEDAELTETVARVGIKTSNGGASREARIVAEGAARRCA